MGKRAPAPPPPPPDYTQEKSEFATSELGRRQTQADAYNQAVGSFNTALAGQRGPISTFGTRVAGLGIQDLGAEPGMPQPNFANQLGNLRSTVSNMDFNRAAPSWESTVQSPWGAVSVGRPTLQSPNENLRSNLLSDIGRIGGTLQNLQSQRAAEESRVRGFRSGLLGDIGGLTGDISRTSIGNEAGINTLGSRLGGLSTRLSGFDSPISQQLYATAGGEQTFPTINTALTGARSALSDLGRRRTDELGRIEDFRTGLRSGYDDLRSRFDPLTIADEPEMQSLGRDIEAQRLGIERFDSPIATDFTRTSRNLGGLSGELQGLFGERRAEQDRIGTAEQRAEDVAQRLGTDVAGTGIYSATDLDALGNAIGDARGDISKFSSLLPFDFSRATGGIGEAETALAGLRGERAETLDDILARASQAGVGVGDIPLHDEAAMRERLSGLSDVSGELGQFTGGRVGDIQGTVEASRGQIDARLEELATRRNEIETQAQGLLESVGADNFSDLESIAARMEEMGLVQEQQQLFAAAQALDEITGIENRLNSEKQRLETDFENRDLALLQERNKILAALGPGGVPQFESARRSTPMSAQEYLALLARNSADDEDIQLTTGSPFSGSLGVIQV